MKEVELLVNKVAVYDEVAKETSYESVKMLPSDESAYERIFTTDEDRELLERYWVETCNAVTGEMKRYLKSVSEQPISRGIDLSKNYQLRLEVPSSFDDRLVGSIETGLHSVFVSSILSRWYEIVDKPDDATRYASRSEEYLRSVMSKVWYKMRPRRVAP
nr:MAG TPA: hypothetical protein [Caudoviricetes sp.]